MFNVSRGLFIAAVAVALCLGALLPGNRLDAQDKEKAATKGDPVKITTIDGVDLHGLFFPSAKKDAPTIIVLHPLNETGMSKSYTSFAEAVQADYSVMLFDFRGHGKSKDIDPALFRKHPFNQKVKGDYKKTTIEFSEFSKDYYPALCNDIAAVKAFLDRKNDAGACNTSSTILVGAETGATLGAVWLNSQWSLYRLIPQAGALMPPLPAPNPEGKDVIACVWLTIANKLGTYEVNLGRTLAVPVKGNGTATVFIYGGEDKAGKNAATGAMNSLKIDTKDTKYQFVKEYGVKGNTNLKGFKLLSKGLTTQNDIIGYLETVVEKKGQESGKRDFRTSDFIWKIGPQAMPAKTRLVDPNNLLYEPYQQFIMR